MASEPSVLILTGYGLNCEAESRAAWERAGARATLMHLNDLFDDPSQLHRYQALMFIGGFSFGDHMGSGHVFAARIRRRMQGDLTAFIQRGGLVLGVCNGFQIMVKLGLLPGLDGDYRRQTVTLTWNDTGVFRDAWVHLTMESESPCVFTQGLERLYLPVRHGEGKFLALDDALLDRLEAEGLVPCRYADPETGEPTAAYPHNPNGSARAIAGLCDPTGRIFGMMPHPEAFLFPWNHPRWSRIRLAGDPPPHGQGLALFRNAVAFAQEHLA